MSFIRICLAASIAALVFLTVPSVALADVPIGPARYVPCPAPTGDPALYRGASTPYRCHSAVVDPLGNVVILRTGRSNGAAGKRAFGWLHALQDHNVEDEVIERVVSSTLPRTAPDKKFRYTGVFRAFGYETMTVWVEVDRAPSRDAPDSQQFGVVTAYCKLPAKNNFENKCPDWVNGTL